MTVTRLKTYTGESGNVYQYYFVGKRAALEDEPYAPATEFIFDVPSERKPTFAISIFLRSASLVYWQQQHGRELSETEQYAAAKMRLFRAFDEIKDMMEQGRRLPIGTEELEELVAQLGVD